MNRAELEAERERGAKECEDAYFNAEEINGISPQMPDNSFRIGFDAAVKLMRERENKLLEQIQLAHDYLEPMKEYVRVFAVRNMLSEVLKNERA